ncbi:hypothetical protein ACWEKM_40495 [Streptomyces sp. NPDC004752]
MKQSDPPPSEGARIRLLTAVTDPLQTAKETPPTRATDYLRTVD